MTTFYLMRHGNSIAGDMVSGRMAGMHLSPDGREQAIRLSEMLKDVPFDAIFSSPLERTRETAAPLCEQKKIKPQILEDIVEVEFGSWTGKSFSELERDEAWKLFHTFRSGTRPPGGGELMVDVQKRMVDRIENLQMEYPQGTLALFSHGDPIKVAIAHYVGMPLDFILRLKISTASFSVISLEKWGATIHCINHTGGLPDSKPF